MIKNLQPIEDRFEQPKKEFKSNFKAWIRMVAFILVAVFLPEQAAQAVEYDWRVIWNKPAVNSIAPGYLKNLENIDTALAIRNILKDISNKSIDAIKVSSNLTIKLDKPLKMSNQKIDEITEWLKGKPCGSKALADYLNYAGIKVAEGDVAIMALTVDILNDIIRPEGNPEVIKNSLYALSQSSKFFGADLYPVKIQDKLDIARVVPFIAHLNYDHYILVTRVTADKVYYIDNHREEFLPKDTFLEKFSGYALTGILPAGIKILDPSESKQIMGAGDDDRPKPVKISLPSYSSLRTQIGTAPTNNVFYASSFVSGLNNATGAQSNYSLYYMDDSPYRRQTVYNSQNNSVAGYTWVPIRAGSDATTRQVFISSGTYQNALVIERTPNTNNTAASYSIKGSLFSSLYENSGRTNYILNNVTVNGTHAMISFGALSNAGFTPTWNADKSAYVGEIAGLTVEYPGVYSGETGAMLYDRAVNVYMTYAGDNGTTYDKLVSSVYASPNLTVNGGINANNIDVNFVSRKDNLTYAFSGNLNNPAQAAPVTFYENGQRYDFAAWVDMKPVHLQVDMKGDFADSNYTNVALWNYQKITAATAINFGDFGKTDEVSTGAGASGNLSFMGWNPALSSPIKQIYVEMFNDALKSDIANNRIASDVSIITGYKYDGQVFTDYSGKYKVAELMDGGTIRVTADTKTLSTDFDSWIVGIDRMYATYGATVDNTTKTYFFPIYAVKTGCFADSTLAAVWTQTENNLKVEAFNDNFRFFNTLNPVLYADYSANYNIDGSGNLTLANISDDKGKTIMALNDHGTTDTSDDTYIYTPSPSRTEGYYDYNVGGGNILLTPGKTYESTNASPMIGGTIGSTVIEIERDGGHKIYNYYEVRLGFDDATGKFTGLALSSYDMDLNGKISLTELRESADTVLGDMTQIVDEVESLEATPDFFQWLKDNDLYWAYMLDGMSMSMGGGGVSYYQMDLLNQYEQEKNLSEHKDEVVDGFSYTDPETGKVYTLDEISSTADSMLANPRTLDLLTFSNNLNIANSIREAHIVQEEGQNSNKEAMGVTFKASVISGIEWNTETNSAQFTIQEVTLTDAQAQIAKDMGIVKDGWTGTFDLDSTKLAMLRSQYYGDYRDLAVNLVGINATGVTWGDIGVGAVIVVTTVAAAALTWYAGGAGGAAVVTAFGAAGLTISATTGTVIALSGAAIIGAGISIGNSALLKYHLTGQGLTTEEYLIAGALGALPAAGGIAGKLLGTAALTGGTIAAAANITSKVLIAGTVPAFISGQITQASAYICNVTVDPVTGDRSTFGPTWGQAAFSLGTGYLYGAVSTLAPVTSVSSFLLRTGINFALNEAVLQGSSLVTTGEFVWIEGDGWKMHLLMLGAAGLSSGASWLSGYSKNVGELGKFAASGYGTAEGGITASIVNNNILSSLVSGGGKILSNAVSGGRAFMLLGMISDPIFNGKEGNPTFESTLRSYTSGLIYGGIFGAAEAIPAFSRIGAQSVVAQGLKWAVIGGTTNVVRGAVDNALFTDNSYTWGQAGIDFGVGAVTGGVLGGTAAKLIPNVFLAGEGSSLGLKFAQLGVNISLTSIVSISGGLVDSWLVTGVPYSWKQLAVDTGIGVLAGLTATALPKYVSKISKLDNTKIFSEEFIKIHPKIASFTTSTLKFASNLAVSQAMTYTGYMGVGMIYEAKNGGDLSLNKIGNETLNYLKIWTPWTNPSADSWANTIKFDIFGKQGVELKYLVIGAGLASLLTLSVVTAKAFAAAKIESLEDLPKLIKESYQKNIASQTLGQKAKAIALSSVKMFGFGMILDTVGRTYNEIDKNNHITNEAIDNLTRSILGGWGVGGWTDKDGKFNWDSTMIDKDGNLIRVGLLSSIENAAISGLIFGPLFYYASPLFEVLAPNLPFGIGKTVQTIQSFNFGMTAANGATNNTLASLRADKVKLALSTAAKFGLITVIGGVIDEGISEPIAGALMYAGLMPLLGGRISAAQLNFLTSMLAEGVSPSPFETVEIGLPSETNILQGIVNSNGEKVISIISFMDSHPTLMNLSKESITGIIGNISETGIAFGNAEDVDAFVDIALGARARKDNTPLGKTWLNNDPEQLGMGVLLLNLAKRQLDSQSTGVLRAVVGANFAAGKTQMALIVQNILTANYPEVKILYVTSQDAGKIITNPAFAERSQEEINVIKESEEGKVTEVQPGQINITDISGFEALKEENKLGDVFVIGDEPQAGMAAPARVHGITEILWNNLSRDKQIEYSAYKGVHELIWGLADTRADQARGSVTENGFWRGIIHHQADPSGNISRDRFEFEEGVERGLISDFRKEIAGKSLTPSEEVFVQGLNEKEKALYFEARQKYAGHLLDGNSLQLKEYLGGAAYGLVTGKEGIEFYGVKKENVDGQDRMTEYFTRNTENGDPLYRTIFSDGEVNGERLNARAVMVSVKHNASPEVWLNSLMSKAENSVSYADALSASKGYILLTASPEGFKPTFDAIGARLYMLDRDPSSLILSGMKINVSSSSRAETMANEAVVRISDPNGKNVVIYTGNSPEDLKLAYDKAKELVGNNVEVMFVDEGESEFTLDDIGARIKEMQQGKSVSEDTKVLVFVRGLYDASNVGEKVDRPSSIALEAIAQAQKTDSRSVTVYTSDSSEVLDLALEKVRKGLEGNNNVVAVRGENLAEVSDQVASFERSGKKVLVFVGDSSDVSELGTADFEINAEKINNVKGDIIVTNVALTTDVVQAGGRFSIEGVSEKLAQRRISGELEQSISLDDPRITNEEVKEIVLIENLIEKSTGENKALYEEELRQAVLRINNRLLVEANADNVVRVVGARNVANRVETERILSEFERNMDWVIEPVTADSLDEVSRGKLNSDKELTFDNDKDNPALTPAGKKFVVAVDEASKFSNEDLKSLASLAEQLIAAKQKLAERFHENMTDQERSQLAFDIIHQLKISGLPIDDSLLKALLEVVRLNSSVGQMDNHSVGVKISLQDLVSGILTKEQLKENWGVVSQTLLENGWAKQISPTVIRLVINPKDIRKMLSERFVSQGIDLEKAQQIQLVLQRSIKNIRTLNAVVGAGYLVNKAISEIKEIESKLDGAKKGQVKFTKTGATVDPEAFKKKAEAEQALVKAEQALNKAWQALGSAIADSSISPVEILLNKAEKQDDKLYKQLKEMYGPLVSSLQASRVALTAQVKGRFSGFVVNARFKSAFNRLYKNLFFTPVSLFNKSSNPYYLTVPFVLGLRAEGSIKEFNRLISLTSSQKKTIQDIAREAREAFINDVKRQAVPFFEKEKIDSIKSEERADFVLKIINLINESDSGKNNRPAEAQTTATRSIVENAVSQAFGNDLSVAQQAALADIIAGSLNG
ncbi:MAG: hypothetical protein M0R00_04690, partial [Candidatus Omnitrophica bacterium]|nr:hypothetical protein [Candidatus Omnitrophota bacterium]